MRVKRAGRSRQLAVALMLGVTIIATTGLAQSPVAQSGRRFLAVDNDSGRSLLTVVTDASTATPWTHLLYAGLQVRVYGVKTGRTIHARRIEIMR